MRKILCFLTLLLLASIAVAEETKNDWVIAGGNISVDGGIIDLNYDFERETVMSNFQGDKFILGKGQCFSTSNIKICFEDTRFSFDKNWGKYDPEKQIEIPEINIIIHKYEPKVEIKREFPSKELFVGDSFTVKVTIENTGDSLAKDLHYYEKLPDGLRLTNVEGAEMKGISSILWSGDIDEKKEFSYTAKILHSNISKYKSHTNYIYNKQNVRTESKEKKIDVKDIIEMKVNDNNNKFEINKEFDYKIDLINHKEPKNFSLLIEIDNPSIFGIDKKNFTKVKDGIYYLEGHIKKQLEEHIGLKTLKTGDSIINTTLSFDDKEITSDRKFEISIEKIEPEIILTENEMKSDEFGFVRVSIDNNNQEFSDFSYNIKSNILNNTENTIRYVDKKEHIDLLTHNFRVPWVEEKKEHYVSFEAEYTHENGQIFNFSMNKTFSFIPKNFEKGMEIQYDVPKTLIFNDTYNLDYTILNMRKQRVYDFNISNYHNGKLLEKNNNIKELINNESASLKTGKFTAINNSVIETVIEYKREIIGEEDERLVETKAVLLNVTYNTTTINNTQTINETKKNITQKDNTAQENNSIKENKTEEVIGKTTTDEEKGF